MSEQLEREQLNAGVAIEPLLVRVEEAARILCLSRSTIYELMYAGELPSLRHGTARRIPVAALREWVARRTTPASVR